MRLRYQRGWKAKAMLGVLCIAIAPLWSSASKAETQVYLLRGWFGVFSTGLDSIAAELRSKGIKAETVGHLAWKTTVANIIKDHASGKSGPLVLIGIRRAPTTSSIWLACSSGKTFPSTYWSRSRRDAGSDPGQCGPGHQLLQFTGLGRARNRRCRLSRQADEHQSRRRHRHQSYGH